jgi:predicted porin
MNKKLIAIGIAAALAAPLAAQAGVEVYVDARASLDFVNNNDNTPGNKDSTVSLSSNYSNIGFKGDEDLGAGLTALWQVEQEVDFDTGTWGSRARDTYVGIAGGFGSVLAGHMRTPYRAATVRLDPFADTRGDSSAIIGSTGNLGGTAAYGLFNDEFRASNMITYMTPDLSGFNAAVAYVMSDAIGDDNLPKTSAADDRNAYSLSVGYNNGPIFATAGYESISKAGLGGGTGTPDAQAYKIGGSYTIMDATTIGALFENIDLGGTIGDRNAWSLNVSHKIGSTTLMAAYTAADDNSTSSSGASQYSIGVKQALSKNTEVYALWTQVSNDDNAAYSLDNTPGVVTGQDMSAFSLGINVMFSSK